MASCSRVSCCVAVLRGSWRRRHGAQSQQDQIFFSRRSKSLRGSSIHRNIRRRSQCRCSTAQLEALGITETGEFSISDEELLARGFQLHRSLDDIDLDDLNALFVKVGFPRRHNDKLLRALEHTGTMLWVTKAGNIIAFARATGDDVFNAIIWDVVVDPLYQGIGLGKAVMERLMADLRKKGISNIVLYAEPNVLGFYKPLGFVVDPDGIRAMSLSRKRRS